MATQTIASLSIYCHCVKFAASFFNMSVDRNVPAEIEIINITTNTLCIEYPGKKLGSNHHSYMTGSGP